MSWFKRCKPEQEPVYRDLLAESQTRAALKSVAEALAAKVQAERKAIRYFGSLHYCPKCECDAQTRKLDTYSVQKKEYLTAKPSREDKEGWPPGVTTSWSTSYDGLSHYMAAGLVEETLLVTCSGCGFTLGREWPADHEEEL